MSYHAQQNVTLSSNVLQNVRLFASLMSLGSVCVSAFAHHYQTVFAMYSVHQNARVRYLWMHMVYADPVAYALLPPTACAMCYAQ